MEKQKVLDFLTSNKIAFCLIIFFSIITFFTLALRDYPIGIDSYNYLSFVFGLENSIMNENVFVHGLFSLFPPSFLFWAFISTLLVFCSSVVVGLIGKHLFPKYGFWSGVIVWMGMFFQSGIIQLEPLSFGVLLCLVSSLFFIKNGQRLNIKSLALLLISLSIWEGSVLFFLIFSLHDKRLLPFSVLIILFNFGALWGGIAPRSFVQENTPIIGGLFFLLFMLKLYAPLNISSIKQFFDIRKYFNFKINNRIIGFVLGFSWIAFLSIKFLVLAVPFLAINLTGKVKKPQFLIVLSIISIFAVIGSSIQFYNFYPNQQIVEGINTGISINTNVQNDWDLGHWIKFFGGEPSARYGSSGNLEKDFWFSCDNRTVLTQIDLNQEFKKIGSFEKFNVFICNKAELKK